jgi:outer membrane protein OmpA-like peptidoglycan-associated protein
MYKKCLGRHDLSVKISRLAYFLGGDMADIYDDEAQQSERKSSKAWLIFGIGLLAAAGFGWQFLSSSGYTLNSLLSGGTATENRDTPPTSRPLSSGKISTGGNDTEASTAPAPTLTSNDAPVVNGTARNESSGSLKMTDLTMPAPPSDAAAATPESIAAVEKKLTDKKAALAAVLATPAPTVAPAKVAQVVAAPAATVQGSTPPLKMDKEFRSLLYAVFYRWASADLGPNARSTVTKLIPEALKGVKIVLTGRTDSTGDAALNKILAERRAAAIKNAFVNKGVNGSIIETNINTTGETKLNEGTVAPLLPKAGNNRARRVDIYIEAKDGSGGGMKR